MPSTVTAIKPASGPVALKHFESLFEFETDCWDVNNAMALGQVDFVLLDVRSHEDYEKGHVQGAISIPHAKIIESRMSQFPRETVFVTYCSGPHCNGAYRGAVRLAKLGRPVKIMIGGIAGWLDERYPLVPGTG